MEMRSRSKGKITLAGLFTRYMLLFCANVAGILFLILGIIAVLLYGGILLPADYAEQQIKENQEKYRTTDHIDAEQLPSGCTYGVYESGGTFLYGNFTEEEIKGAQRVYRGGYTELEVGHYYYFIEREDKTVCAISYPIKMRFRKEAWNERIPEAESFVILLAAVMFLLLLLGNAFFLSRKFSKTLRKRLEELKRITGKIAASDLEFAAGSSDIREIDEVMISMDKLKEALRSSLQEQWLQESRKREEMSAIAHDIKTPLTVIRGNAELLLEEEQTEVQRESAEYILSSAQQITRYLNRLREVLQGTGGEEERVCLSAEEFVKLLCEKAQELAAAQKLPVKCEHSEMQGMLACSPEMLLRAWENLLSNALEYTDPAAGIRVCIREQEACSGDAEGAAEWGSCWIAEVFDYGRGFSAKDLRYADQKLYSGDESRHDRGHQGLGLAIARQFAGRQGGELSYGNWKDEKQQGGAFAGIRLPIVVDMVSKK